MGQPLTYFAVYLGAFDGDKARDLEHELRRHVPEGFAEVVVAGVLAKLWHRAAKEGEDDGSLGAMPARRLARVLGWPLDPELLVEALEVTGWVTRVEPDDQPNEGDRTYRPHDWSGNQPAIADRIRKRDYMRQKRAQGPEPEQLSLEHNFMSPDVPEHTPSSHLSSRNLRQVGREVGREVEEEEISPPSEESVASPPKSPPGPTPQQVADLWAEVCVPAGRPALRKLTDDRKRKVKARTRQDLPTLEAWRGYFERIAASSFLRGETERWPKGATFDFAVASERNVTKVLEGDYDDRAPPAKARGEPPKDDPWAQVIAALPAWGRREDFDLPQRISVALRAIGGLSTVASSAEKDLPMWRRKFLDAYHRPGASERRGPRRGGSSYDQPTVISLFAAGGGRG